MSWYPGKLIRRFRERTKAGIRVFQGQEESLGRGTISIEVYIEPQTSPEVHIYFNGRDLAEELLLKGYEIELNILPSAKLVSYSFKYNEPKFGEVYSEDLEKYEGYVAIKYVNKKAIIEVK